MINRIHPMSEGLASVFILLILAIISLFTLSLFRNSVTSQYIVRNEMAASRSFYRAQAVATQMIDSINSLHDSRLISAINNPSQRFSWLQTEDTIDLKQINSLTYWNQLTPRNYPPDSQAIAVFLNVQPIHAPGESLVMTHDRQSRIYRFSIIAKSVVAGSMAIVETGLGRRMTQ